MPDRLRLADQDRDAGLELRRLDGHGQSPAEARLEPLLEAIDLSRVAITGQDDLVLALEQGVEGVEELLLRVLLAGEELDIVDQQRVQRAVGGLEVVDPIVLQRPHHVAHEALRVYVGHARFLVAFGDEVADRVHEVRFAEADAAVDEQRVVGAARIARDLQRRRLGKVVALAFDEAVEGEIVIERHADRLRAALEYAWASALASSSRGGRDPTSTVMAAGSAMPRSRSRAPMRVIRWLRTQSTTKRLGASSRNAPSASTDCSGRTQVLNCCSGSSLSSAVTQRDHNDASKTRAPGKRAESLYRRT